MAGFFVSLKVVIVTGILLLLVSELQVCIKSVNHSEAKWWNVFNVKRTKLGFYFYHSYYARLGYSNKQSPNVIDLVPPQCHFIGAVQVTEGVCPLSSLGQPG
jgi:hypothetical protein